LAVKSGIIISSPSKGGINKKTVWEEIQNGGINKKMVWENSVRGGNLLLEIIPDVSLMIKYNLRRKPAIVTGSSSSEKRVLSKQAQSSKR